MDLQTLRNEIQVRTEDNSLDSTKMDRWINQSIKQVAARADWPWLIEQDSSTTTTASTIEYSLPTDFKKMLSVRVGGTTEPDGTEYSFIDYKNKNISSQGNWYYINSDDSTLGLIPTPATTGDTIWLKYYEIPADLTATTDEPPFSENYHEICVFFALKKYWEMSDEFQKVLYYDTEFENTIERMKNDATLATGQLKRMRDVRELMVDNQPQKLNSINNG